MLRPTPPQRSVPWRGKAKAVHTTGRAQLARQKCRGMYVPSDSFGGLSPEKKAANAMRNLFTFIAVKIILAQLEGSGRGALASYNEGAYRTLMQQLEEVPLRDGDAWLEVLMQKDRMLALRVMEVREAYSSSDFEWDQLQRLAIKDTKEANMCLMRSSAVASLKATAAAEAGQEGSTAQGTQQQQQQEQRREEAASSEAAAPSSTAEAQGVPTTALSSGSDEAADPGRTSEKEQQREADAAAAAAAAAAGSWGPGRTAPAVAAGALTGPETPDSSDGSGLSSGAKSADIAGSSEQQQGKPQSEQRQEGGLEGAAG